MFDYREKERVYEKDLPQVLYKTLKLSDKEFDEETIGYMMDVIDTNSTGYFTKEDMARIMRSIEWPLLTNKFKGFWLPDRLLSLLIKFKINKGVSMADRYQAEVVSDKKNRA